MPQSLVMQSKESNLFLHVKNGNIPTRRRDVEWVPSPDQATIFPGQCYIDYAYKMFREKVDQNMLVLFKSI